VGPRNSRTSAGSTGRSNTPSETVERTSTPSEVVGKQKATRGHTVLGMVTPRTAAGRYRERAEYFAIPIRGRRSVDNSQKVQVDGIGVRRPGEEIRLSRRYLATVRGRRTGTK